MRKYVDKKIAWDKLKNLNGFVGRKEKCYFLGNLIFQYFYVCLFGENGLYHLHTKYYLFNIGEVPSRITVCCCFNTSYEFLINININDCYQEDFPYDPKMVEIYKDVIKKKIPFGVFFDYLKDISVGKIGKM